MEQITLKNGFRIFLEPQPWFASCALGLFIGSGSRYETPQTLGVSHFIEHMLFKGTESLSARRIAEISDDMGGTLNAYTTKEYTCLYARVLKCNVREMLSMISDMALHPALREDELETEKGVILEERNGYEDSPEDLCMDTFYESFWPDDLLGQNIVGTRETILGINAETIRAHLQKYYVPERMVAVFCGAFNRDEVVSLCESHFGALQNTNNPLTFSSPRTEQFVRCVHKDLQQNVLALGLPGLPLEDKRMHALNYACAVLGGATSSRLFQRIREELGLVYSIDAFRSSFLGAGAICILLGLSAENETAALKETLRLFCAFPGSITQKEFDRTKMQALSGITMSLESPASVASRIGSNALLRGEVLSVEETLEEIRAVTLDEVQQIARELFCPERLSLCAVGKTQTEEEYRSILQSDFEV